MRIFIAVVLVGLAWVLAPSPRVVRVDVCGVTVHRCEQPIRNRGSHPGPSRDEYRYRVFGR